MTVVRPLPELSYATGIATRLTAKSRKIKRSSYTPKGRVPESPVFLVPNPALQLIWDVQIMWRGRFDERGLGAILIPSLPI
jgi:hypothetical protein